jgi:ABC-type sugar transport system substrate-binding protein
MDHAMKVEASLNSELELTIFQANRNPEVQIAQIESMIDNDFDVIIISPFESESITPIVEKAYKKGIPVILVDRNANTDLFTTYLGADKLEVGE